MDLVNIASPKYQCRVLKASSSENEVQHPPSSILAQENDNVWVSGQGLPQQLIISLQDVQFAYQHISAVTFVCAHDYETNPKVIEIWIAKDEKSIQNGQYIFWNQVKMKKKRGKQMFSISQIPESHRIIKFKITQTYGEYQTYLNQVMLMAQPDQQTSQSLYNQQEWHKLTQMKGSNKLRENKTKTSRIKNRQPSNKNIFSPNEHSPLDILNKGIQSDEIQSKNENKLQIDDIQENSFEKNAAILAMSKNMLIMQDNIEELTRKVQVLEKKVDYTYQNLQSNLLRKIDEMIDKKIQKQLSQRQLIIDQPRRLNSCKDLTTSRTVHHGQQKQKKVMSLVAELNGKLKQRAKLATKLQKKLKIPPPKSQYYD